MLTSITLQNFKGIGERMTIPLRPITLLFGANSTGKSTIIQAIHYMREILERSNVNADRALHGGDTIDLGGFLNLLHNRDKQNKMLLRFDYNVGVITPDYLSGENTVWRDVSDDWNSSWVELAIEWSPFKEEPVLTCYETGINGLPAARIVTSLDKAEYHIEINELHPLVEAWDEDESFDKPQWKLIEVANIKPELPVWGESLNVKKIGHSSFESILDSLSLTQILTGPGDLLRYELGKFRYLGPLRKAPVRQYRPSLTVGEEDWADGIAAWDALYRGSQEFIDEVSEWMANGTRLKTGYSVRRKRFREIPAESPLLNELLIALKNETFYDNYDLDYFERELNRYDIKHRLVLVADDKNLEVMPTDVGVGISQVLPVVVAALGTTEGILAIEQPELHLHPAVQTRLGDLFIESALGQRKNMLLLETHSEHLILRLLRRIRETTEGDLPDVALPLKPEDLQVLYVKSEAGATKLFSLPITSDGDFAVKWPDGFFEERAEEIF